MSREFLRKGFLLRFPIEATMIPGWKKQIPDSLRHYGRFPERREYRRQLPEKGTIFSNVASGVS